MHPIDYEYLIVSMVEMPPVELCSLTKERFLRPSRFSDPNAKKIYHIDKGAFDHRDAYVDYPSGNAGPWDVIVWEPKSHRGTSAFMVNKTDPMLLAVDRMSKEFSCYWIQVLIHDTDPVYPSTRFRYFHGEIRREIMNGIFENGWYFYQDGDPLSFEDLNHYATAENPDKFNRQIALEYLEKLGYDLKDPEFWVPNSPALRFWQEITWQ